MCSARNRSSEPLIQAMGINVPGMHDLALPDEVEVLRRRRCQHKSRRPEMMVRAWHVAPLPLSLGELNASGWDSAVQLAANEVVEKLKLDHRKESHRSPL